MLNRFSRKWRPSIASIIPVISLCIGLADPANGYAQGCMPSRFASPLHPTKGDVYLPANTWHIGIGYQRAVSDQKVVGHTALSVLANGKIPSRVVVDVVELNVAYGFTNRLSLTTTVPFQHGSHTTTYDDGLRHENTATGLGDVSMVANYWLRNSTVMDPGGNVAIGLGVKTATGSHNYLGTYWQTNGSTVRFPVHPSIELGDGGWGTILQVEGFEPLFSMMYLYGASSYTLSTRRTTEVTDDPESTTHWSVPDTWDMRLGAAYVLSAEYGISTTLGIRFDGTPRSDLIGGRDFGARLPATVGFAEPGLSFSIGDHNFTVSVPVRVYQNFQPSYANTSAGEAGGGGLSRYMVSVGYSARF